MAKGLVVPTVPTDDDIIMGEFKLYANYNLPTQLNVGATRGGLKVDLQRSIKEIDYDGSFGATKGLRRYEKFNVKAIVNQLCLKYFNADIISDCESDSLWESKAWLTASGGVYTAETSITAEGEQSAKATLTSSGDGIHEVFSSTKDLTVFDNGEASATSDFIGFSMYITTQDLTDLGSSDLRITFHQDVEGTETNGWYYDVEAGDLTADSWVAFKVLKSAFSELGTGDWSTITGVSVKLTAAPSAETICYIDHITLIQDQSKSTIVPVNAGGMDYTDEGDYRKFVPTLVILDSDYLENLVIIGQKLGGKVVRIWLYQVLNDGKVSLGMKEKDEVVNETEYTAHFKSSTPTTVPLRIETWDV